MENDTATDGRKRGPKPAAHGPTWFADPQAVDVAVAAMLDSAERGEAAAAAAGSVRFAAAGIRQLRHQARTLAQALGTPNALADPPVAEVPPMPVKFGRTPASGDAVAGQAS